MPLSQIRRIQPNWFTESDELILELLGKCGVALNKRGIELNLESNGKSISYSTIKRRVDKLVDTGFIEIVREEGSYYRITGKGMNYLTGTPYVAAVDEAPQSDTKVHPVEYEIVEKINQQKEPPTSDTIISSIPLRSEYIHRHIDSLIAEGLITKTEEDRLKLSLGAKYILQFFRLSDVEVQTDQYGLVE